ncbi:MAG: hypothetical protein IIY93_08085 [Clostridia bacterium]|nr:hypothetical protein [Clostridia bacterium]
MKIKISNRMTMIIVLLVLMILFAAGLKLYLYQSSQSKPAFQTEEAPMLDPDDNEDSIQPTNPDDDGFGTEVSM